MENKKLSKVLFIIGISLFIIAGGLIVATFVLSYIREDETWVNFAYYSAIAAVLGFTVLLIRMFLCKPQIRQNFEEQQFQKPNEAPVVDVKPVEQPKQKTQQEQLVDRYEELYKNGYITKQEFEQKKKEILN